MGAEDQDLDDFLAELEDDPEHRRRRAALDAEHAAAVARDLDDSSPMLRELAQHGFTVESVYDLFEQDLDYEAVIPVLLRWLPRMDNTGVKCGIIRALSVVPARPVAALPLVAELKRLLPDRGLESDDVRWTIANALEVVADEAVLDDLLALVRDQRLNLDTRAMLVRALGNIPDPRTGRCIIDLLQDERADVPLIVSGLISLGRLRFQPARELAERYLQHAAREVRSEARRTLKALNNSQTG